MWPIPRASGLMGLALANVIVHVIGLGFAAYGIKPGTPLAPLHERIKYLAAAPLGWTLGWATWMACALLLVAFLAAVAVRVTDHRGMVRLGLTVAVAGLAFDWACDSIYIVVFPQVAALEPPQEALFLAIERVTAIGSLVIANGAYSVAILLISLGLRVYPPISPRTVGLGCAVAGFGLVLAAAGFTNDPWHAAAATPPTIGLFCIWVIAVARAVGTERTA